jgi:LPS-assembly protein
MRIPRLLIFFSMLGFLGSPLYPTWANPILTGEQSALIQGISIIADSMDRDTQNETVDLVGNVQVIYENQHLTCERAKINLRSKSIDASGNVKFTTPRVQISGARVLLEYESGTGLIYDGYVQSGNVIFEGSQIQKLSDVEYIADNARYTTCTTCPEAWNFSGEKIRAELGGYAYIKNSVMKFGGVPTIWLPYIAVPLKTDRQSGLLTPSIGNRGEGGLTYSQGYFWAISRSTDATINLTNYEFRGLKTLANYRYVLSESSSGELDFGFLNDRVFSEDQRLNKFRSENDRTSNSRFQRWFLKYNNYFELPEGFVQRTQINTASDLQYPKDFPLETLNNGDPAMESRVSISKNSTHYHWSVDASYYQNLLQSNPVGDNETAVHRIPEIQFSRTLTRLGETDFLAGFDFKYNNFVRFGSDWDNLTFKDINGNQIHDENEPYYIKGSGLDCDKQSWEQDPNCRAVEDGQFIAGQDLIRTGQRLIFNPQLMYPVKYGSLELTPAMNYHETHYYLPVSGEDESPQNVRRYLRLETSARTTFSRIYGDFSSLQSERIKHEVLPELKVTYIPWVQQPRNRFFGVNNSEESSFQTESSVSELDLNGVNGLQFDYYDRVINRKMLSLALTNKLTRKYWENGQPNYRQFFTWRLAQTHDIYKAEKNPNTQTPNLNSDITFNFDWVVLSNSSVYHFFQEVSDSNTRIRLIADSTDFIQVEQFLKYDLVDTEQRTGPRRESYVVSGKKGISWLDLIGKIGYSANPADYLSQWGYGAQIRFPGDCFYIGVVHYQQAIDKKPEIDISMHFSWDGNKIPRISESIVDRFGF